MPPGWAAHKFQTWQQGDGRGGAGYRGVPACSCSRSSERDNTRGVPGPRHEVAALARQWRNQDFTQRAMSSEQSVAKRPPDGSAIGAGGRPGMSLGGSRARSPPVKGVREKILKFCIIKVGFSCILRELESHYLIF